MQTFEFSFPDVKTPKAPSNAALRSIDDMAEDSNDDDDATSTDKTILSVKKRSLNRSYNINIEMQYDEVLQWQLPVPANLASTSTTTPTTGDGSLTLLFLSTWAMNSHFFAWSSCRADDAAADDEAKRIRRKRANCEQQSKYAISDFSHSLQGEAASGILNAFEPATTTKLSFDLLYIDIIAN